MENDVVSNEHEVNLRDPYNILLMFGCGAHTWL